MQSASLPAEGSGTDPSLERKTEVARAREAAARRWQRPLIALGVAALVTLLISILPGDNAAEGWVADRLVAARGKLLGSRPLTDSELASVRKVFDQAVQYYNDRPAEASEFTTVGQQSPPHEPAATAAWMTVSSMLLNLDEAMTRE